MEQRKNARMNYTEGSGDNMNIEWTEGFRITVKIADSEVTVSANREGLLSLARQLMDMADMPCGTHIHYDEYNSLEEGSAELIIEKVE